MLKLLQQKLLVQEKLKKLSNNRLNAKIIKYGHPEQERFKSSKADESGFNKWLQVYRDSSSSDSLKKEPSRECKRLAQAMSNPKFRALQEKYQQIGRTLGWGEINRYLPGFDSLGEYSMKPRPVYEHGRRFSFKQLIQHSELGGVSGQIGKVEAIKINSTNLLVQQI